MRDTEWRVLLDLASHVLGPGHADSRRSQSWCAWTTYESLNSTLTYWASGIPHQHELTPTGLIDGGTWGQPFLYSEIAHLIIPAQFYWENLTANGFDNGYRRQDLITLSHALNEAGLPYRMTDLMLEVKLY